MPWGGDEVTNREGITAFPDRQQAVTITIVTSITDGVAIRDLIHAREVSIPNAHPLFREGTPGTRECVDFIGF